VKRSLLSSPSEQLGALGTILNPEPMKASMLESKTSICTLNKDCRSKISCLYNLKSGLVQLWSTASDSDSKRIPRNHCQLGTSSMTLYKVPSGISILFVQRGTARFRNSLDKMRSKWRHLIFMRVYSSSVLVVCFPNVIFLRSVSLFLLSLSPPLFLFNNKNRIKCRVISTCRTLEIKRLRYM